MLAIEVMDAEKALDVAATGRTLICFAQERDVQQVERLVGRYVTTHSFKAVRVPPTVENAEILQLSRFPAFVLFDGGSETFKAVGAEMLTAELQKIIR